MVLTRHRHVARGSLYCSFVVPSRTDASTLATAGFAALASLFLHLLLWPVGNTILSANFEGELLPSSSGAMEVSLLPLEEAQPKDVDPPEEDSPKERLVKLDAITPESRPERADYVSEFDQAVEQQQRAPKQRPQPGPPARRAPAGSTAAPSPSSPALALRPGRTDHDVQGSDADALPEDPHGSQSLVGGGKTAAPLDPRAVPGLSQNLREAWGSPGTMDALDPDLDEGDGNILNTRRFLYASFFNRLRDQVAEHWHPDAAQARHDPNGSLVGRGARRTVLAIALNPEGTLFRIRVHESSGVPFLDEEAIRAVRAASPFSNPPPQLVDTQSGHIDFLFGFILEVGGAKRIFRYRR